MSWMQFSTNHMHVEEHKEEGVDSLDNEEDRLGTDVHSHSDLSSPDRTSDDPEFGCTDSD